MKQNNPANKRLFIGSLPYRFTEGELLSLFISEGKIISLRIMHNQWGKSRGIGYIEYENLDDAIHAKEKYHNYRIGDRTIIVDYAQPDPFLTPEGKARHEEALQKHPNRRQALNYLPHPDSDTSEYQQRRSQAHQSNFTPRNDYQPNSQPQKVKRFKGGKPVFNSLGKSINRDISSEYTPKFFPELSNSSKKKFRPKPGQKPEYKSSSPLHVRSSVFKQRHFGSKVGAKFAAKSKRK